MKNKPLVSILITNYNSKKYIHRCIKSCIDQSYKKIEIVFFDDCSIDKSLEEINKFRKIKVIKNKKRTNYGSYNQINGLKKAFKKSRGKIICFLDSDDFFKKNKILKIVNFLDKNPSTNFVMDLPIIYHNKNNKYLLGYKKRKFIFSSIWPKFTQTSCMSMRKEFCKQALEDVGFFKFPNIWLDFRITVYAFYVKKNFNVLNVNLTYYFQNPNNISSNFKKFSKNWWLRREEAHKYMKFYFRKKNINYQYGIDYLATKIIKNIL